MNIPWPFFLTLPAFGRTVKRSLTVRTCKQSLQVEHPERPETFDPTPAEISEAARILAIARARKRQKIEGPLLEGLK